MTRYSCHPPSSHAMTPPARIPPTQTGFARGPGAVGIGAFLSRAKFPSIGGVAACRRGGKRVRNTDVTRLLTPSYRHWGPRKYECICGVVSGRYPLCSLGYSKLWGMNVYFHYCELLLYQWIPACAGMTRRRGISRLLSCHREGVKRAWRSSK